MDKAQSLSLLTLLLLAPQGLSKGYRSYHSDDYHDYYYDSEHDFEPPTFQARPQTFTVEVGQSVIIPCDVENPGKNKLIIKKFPANGGSEKLLSVGSERVIPDRRITVGEGRLTISHARPRDAGTFLCQFDLEPPLQLRHTLDVQYAPSVKALVAQELHVTKGENVTLSCQAEGNPPPIIRWSRQEGTLPSGQRNQEGENVTLDGVDRHHEGTYLCTADNGIGQPASASMTVTVEYPPEIVVEKAVVQTGDGGQVELVCEVHGRPTPEVVWTRYGQVLPPASYHGNRQQLQHPTGHQGYIHKAHDAHISQSRVAQSHTLTITHVTQKDFGEYACTAENAHGTRAAVIKITGLPNSPRLTSSPNGGESNRYTLTWDTESHSPITEFQIRYRKNQQGPSQQNRSLVYPGSWRHVSRPVAVSAEVSLADPRGNKVRPQHMTHTIEDLEVATDYIAVVRVRNKYGWSNDSDYFNFSTKKAMAVLRSTSSSTGLLPRSPSLLLFAAFFSLLFAPSA
ncbi:protein amalgam-like [Penaeus chinensis]|uniref:protein amalgam-like n=1 Tax=Penaeus chinensis TaxID=139456 RepID=UPI001FB63935|nr:protein amalgam-like [Penaeus chinensis]